MGSVSGRAEGGVAGERRAYSTVESADRNLVPERLCGKRAPGRANSRTVAAYLTLHPKPGTGTPPDGLQISSERGCPIQRSDSEFPRICASAARSTILGGRST